MKIILFENNQVQNLYPITLTRPGFNILCGGITLYDLLKKEFSKAKLDFLVRDYLLKIVSQEYKRNTAADGKILFLDACLVPSFASVRSLAKKISASGNKVLKNKNKIIGAYLDLAATNLSVKDIVRLKQPAVENFLAGLKFKTESVNYPLLEYPWQVITYNEEILSSNLEFLSQDFTPSSPGVYLGKNVTLPKTAVLNSDHGPIIIDSGTTILPFCHLAGPLYIGKNCLVREFTVLKYSCCIGNTSKVGGEIEASIFQGFSNKNHFGFLGYSYLGEWVNLGAGTTNSNLKNNYGLIKMAGLDTGFQFLGCVIGDYSRTAINTAIYTGKVIGVNCHLYGTITNDVPSFTHYARDFGCVVEYDIDKSIELQKIVFARRGRKQYKADAELLKDIFKLTAIGRKEAKIKPGKIFFYGR